MKNLVILLLVAMLVGGAALLHWGPVRGYVVACERTHQIACSLERQEQGGTKRWQFSLGNEASAVVRVRQRRRSSDRVFLYLVSPPHDVFAAEFESDDALADAEAAAAQLNRVFTSTTPASDRVEARPPPYLRWVSWGALGFTALLILACWRELKKPEKRSADSARPT